MALHLIKLCVGVASVEDLKARQRARVTALVDAGEPVRLVHRTRQMPRRRLELCDGGSIYWVIKGAILVRQGLLTIVDGVSGDGRKCCELVLGHDLIEVRPAPRRAFQGWRYLEVEDSPHDLKDSEFDGISKMPLALRRELVELALI